MKYIVIILLLIMAMGCGETIVGTKTKTKTIPESHMIDSDTIIIREITAEIDTTKGD